MDKIVDGEEMEEGKKKDLTGHLKRQREEYPLTGEEEEEEEGGAGAGVGGGEEAR